MHGPLHLLSAFSSSFLQQKTGKQKKNDQRKTYIGLQSQKNDWHGEPFKKGKKNLKWRELQFKGLCAKGDDENKESIMPKERYA